MKIAVDAMGGDFGPAVVVEGAAAAAREFGAVVTLVGDKAAIEREIEHLLRGLARRLAGRPVAHQLDRELQAEAAHVADQGMAFGQAAAGGRRLYGFAEHVVTSTFLGSSAGLRLRHDQPTGKVELQARTADMSESAWDGATTASDEKRRNLSGHGYRRKRSPSSKKSAP